MATATLGGGCFWCLEAVFQRLEGVNHVTSGYAGGHTPNPDYRSVCTGRTGHAEVVQIDYGPERIDFETLLEVFFTIHDPTTRDRQGNDVGPQYRSIILWHDETQRDTARAVIERLQGEGAFRDPIVTELKPLERFYPAEAYHQDYYRENAAQPYCQIVIAPKLKKALDRFGARMTG
ncbi:peptide-methionine (S)-S-oxide reductase MsrA [Sediminicurvatus halobius]|uniref:Peptide methionine sulfoxide reductase MsrA n=1 Tax=Sediminicurvatus halobius TaxID=2182432 RepID=A0A2U2N0S6_9GAMM|nr:peptide-methionine (S)-S-oxide reductase MsrA [Spiribacter halobius]PWG62564.1 peptide-methionine (S)-S-oxide reductase [Spiribacter halobius]UEX78522.1 peptide-methionine (S)-S-oxide reductase MsrA [Spiribacter halobius]